MEQERSYLSRYLSTRAGDDSQAVRRLRALAEQEGVDWHYPPTPQLFAARLRQALAPWRPERRRRQTPA